MTKSYVEGLKILQRIRQNLYVALLFLYKILKSLYFLRRKANKIQILPDG